MMEPAWLRAAYQEMRFGVNEVAGGAHHPHILAYHAVTTLHATSDEVAWCSAFCCWAMQQAGVKHPASARARDWLDWGVAVSPIHPPIGAVMVISRGPTSPGPEVRDAPGHVFFFIGHDRPGMMLGLGGNQSNSVSIASYSVHRLLGVRWAA